MGIGEFSSKIFQATHPPWEVLKEVLAQNGPENNPVPFETVLEADPVTMEIERSKGKQEDTISCTGKIPLLAGVIVDVLLDDDPWVFYAILAEPSERTDVENLAECKTLMLCVHKECIEEYPFLTIVGTAVLVKNASILWVPYEQNATLWYPNCNVFNAKRRTNADKAKSGKEYLDVVLRANLPALTPLIIVTNENVQHIVRDENQKNALEFPEATETKIADSAKQGKNGQLSAPKEVTGHTPSNIEYWLNDIQSQGNASNEHKTNVSIAVSETVELGSHVGLTPRDKTTSSQRAEESYQEESMEFTIPSEHGRIDIEQSQIQSQVASEVYSAPANDNPDIVEDPKECPSDDPWSAYL